MSEIDRFIPLDKSWIMRMGVLDLIDGNDNTANFLQGQEGLSDDLQALGTALNMWHDYDDIPVGESGTLLRFLRFTSFKQGLNKRFKPSGSLLNRPVTNNPGIINWSQNELLTLDNGTSQWASAAALNGDDERIPEPPFKLKTTYEAIDHWGEQKAKGRCWELRLDETIRNQALAFLALNNGEAIDFEPKQAEDFPFAYAFGLIDVDTARQRWPQLEGHESNRLEEVPKMIEKAQTGEEVDTTDHRVTQAVIMWATHNSSSVDITSGVIESVNKSWPEFWDFMEK